MEEWHVITLDVGSLIAIVNSYKFNYVVVIAIIYCNYTFDFDFRGFKHGVNTQSIYQVKQPDFVNFFTAFYRKITNDFTPVHFIIYQIGLRNTH